MSKRSAAETVARIIWAFVGQPTWAQAELARKVDVSSRAVGLRLEELRRGGMLVTRDDEPPHVMWSVPSGWLPDGLALAKDDVGHLIRFLARSPQSATRDALMRRLLRGSAEQAIAANAAALTENEPTLAALEDARAKRQAAQIVYTTGATGVDSVRHVSVQRIEYGPKIRFVAHCHKAGALRWFRLSRVRAARLDSGVMFVAAPGEEIAGFVARSVDGWTDSGPPREVSFRVLGDDARWVPGSLPSVEMMVDACEGGVRVRAVTSGLRVIARFVAGLGGAAVVDTPELAERVEELAMGSLARAKARSGGAGAKAWGVGLEQAERVRSGR